MMKKVAIIDDESAGRKLIREYLEDFPEMIIIAEANNGVDAVREINKFKPDLVFMDIQMPGMTGFDVLTRLEELPQIIFSTAYDKYALQAFEVHAIDYLLKPYTKERFTKALSKIPITEETPNLAPLANSLLMDANDYPERILVQFQKKLVTVAVGEIVWIEAYGDYSKIHVGEQVYVSNYGISILEEKMDPKIFLRVHRSAIINLDQVHLADKYGKGYQLQMKNGEKVMVSRGYKDKLQQFIF